MAVLLAPAAPVFSVSGASSAGDGDTYTLTLTQTQGAPVQSWTINWGDGTIQTVPNTGPTVTHVYSGGTLTNSPDYQIVVTATADDGSTVYTSSTLPDVTVDLPAGDLVSPSSIPPVSFLEYDQEIEQPSAADDSIDLTQLFQDSNPLSYSVVSNSDSTILSSVSVDLNTPNQLDVTLAPDTYGYSEVTVEATDTVTGDTLDATVLVVVTPDDGESPIWIPGENLTDHTDDTSVVANVTLSGSPTYLDLWNYFTDLQDKNYLQYPEGSVTVTADTYGILGGVGANLPVDDGFVTIPALPANSGGSSPEYETFSFSVTATNSAGLTVTGNFYDNVMIPADPSDSGDNYQSQTPELIATATDGVNGSSGVVVLTRSGGYDDVPGDTPNPPLPYLPDMTVQYYVSGEFSPTGVPLSGTLHFSAGSTTPDDGEGIWTITDPDWGSIDPQGPESDTFDFTASDPYYSGASATVTIEPTPPPPSLTLTIGGQADSSDPYYLPLDNGNENNNTAEQWVTVTNPSDGTPETIPVLAPVTNIQQDRHLQNTVTANSNFGSPAANGVVEATLSISYPGVYTTGTLTFDFGDDLGVWWHGAQNQYDRWVPISQGASFGGISANTSYTLLVQGIQDGSDGIDATFVPASSGSGSGGNSQVSGSLPINVFSVSVSISGPTEIVTGATSATEFTVDDGYDLGLTDSEGNLVADDSSTVTQIPLNGNDPYLQTATITFSETVPVGSPYNITIPSGYRLFDPTTGDLITVLSGTVPASRQVTVLVQVTDSAATGSSGGGFFSVADRILVAVMAVGADEPAIGDALAVAPRATTPVEIIRTRAGAANSSTFGPGVLEFGNVQWTFALSQPENVPMVMVQHITVKMSGSMFDPNAAGPGAKISAIGDQQLSYWEVLGTVPAGQLAPKINGKATTDTWFYSGLPENILFVAAKATIRGTVFAFPVSVIGKTIANWNQNTFPFDKQNGFPNIGDWSSGILKGNTDFAIQNAWKTGLWAQEAKTQVLTITFAPGRRNSNVPQLFKINTP